LSSNTNNNNDTTLSNISESRLFANIKVIVNPDTKDIPATNEKNATSAYAQTQCKSRMNILY